jgi:hypothetical protein
VEEDKALVTKAVDELIKFSGGVIRCKKCNEVLSDSTKDTKAAAVSTLYLHLKLKHDLVGNLLGRDKDVD